MSENRESFTLR